MVSLERGCVQLLDAGARRCWAAAKRALSSNASGAVCRIQSAVVQAGRTSWPLLLTAVALTALCVDVLCVCMLTCQLVSFYAGAGLLCYRAMRISSRDLRRWSSMMMVEVLPDRYHVLPGVVSHSAHAEPRSIYAGRQLWGLQNPYYRGLLCGAADEGRAVTCSFKICYQHVALVTLRVCGESRCGRG